MQEIDLGKEFDKIVTRLKEECGDVFALASGDVWYVSIDKAEMEAYDKIKMVRKGEGINAYGVIYHWFTDVSGLGSG